MPALGDLVYKVRSKNAGPFWVTLDIFCGSTKVFETLRRQLSRAEIAGVFHVEASEIKRYAIESLQVIKFSIPRPVVQGDRFDRDMHGAQWAVLMAGMPVEVDSEMSRNGDAQAEK